MFWKQLFTPVKAIEPEEAKAFLARWPEGSYTLLDVRQPGEYEREHLPGARLVPMAASTRLPEGTWTRRSRSLFTERWAGGAAWRLNYCRDRVFGKSIT